MRKLAIAFTVTLLVAALGRPAEAGCRVDCPPWLDVIGYTFAAGLVGGYAYGTGYFIYRDATDAQQSLDYAGGEIGFNALFAAAFTGGTVDAIRHRNAGQAAVLGALAATHGALAGHGVWRVYQHRDQLRPEPRTLAAVAGIAYTANALIWAGQLPDRHGRRYGIAEAAVNAPLAAGLGYLAVDRARGGDTSQAALFGGMAAVSGALALHGVHTAVFQKRGPALDLGLELGVGADVAPTVVTDGKEVAPGLGASGTW